MQYIIVFSINTRSAKPRSDQRACQYYLRNQKWQWNMLTMPANIKELWHKIIHLHRYTANIQQIYSKCILPLLSKRYIISRISGEGGSDVQESRQCTTMLDVTSESNQTLFTKWVRLVQTSLMISLCRKWFIQCVQDVWPTQKHNCPFCLFVVSRNGPVV